MCRRSEAIAEVTLAAHCLSDACATRLAAGEALRGIYAGVVREGVPPEMVETLGKLGFSTGAKRVPKRGKP